MDPGAPTTSGRACCWWIVCGKWMLMMSVKMNLVLGRRCAGSGVGLEVECSADYMWKGRGRWSIPVDRRPTGLTISSAHHRVDSMAWPA